MIRLASKDDLGLIDPSLAVLVLHRDLKPGNILLMQEGGGASQSMTSTDGIWSLSVKVADFGLSRFLPVSAESVTVTKRLGTLGYWAPEVQQGKR